MAWEEVKLEYVLPDGGVVEVTDDTFSPLGDEPHQYTYKQLTYRNEGVQIVFEVRDGIPGCVSINLRAGERPIRQKDLAAIKLDQIRDEAFLAVGMIIVSADAGEQEPTYRHVRQTLNRATSRRKITPDFLSRVAKVYSNAPEGDRVQAVKAAFTPAPSERQAWRYIAAAREAGLLK